MIIGISASGFCSIFLPWFELLCVVLSSGGFCAAVAASFCSTTTSSPGSFVMLDKAISKASNASFVSRSSSSLSFSNRAISFSRFFNAASETFFSGSLLISALNFSRRSSDFPSSLMISPLLSTFSPPLPSLQISSSSYLPLFHRRTFSLCHSFECFNFLKASCSYFLILFQSFSDGRE